MMAAAQLTAGNAYGGTPRNLTINGEPVITLKQPARSDHSKPYFREATILPGRGMAVLQIKAYLPGKGEIDLLNAPPLAEAEKLLDNGDDEWGNQIFKIGGAILLPFANRIRGTVSPDGKTITATVAGKTSRCRQTGAATSPARRSTAIHGLMRRLAISARHASATERRIRRSAPCLHAGNFDGHWLSDTDVKVETTLSHDAFEMTVTAKNVGHEPLPMGIGWHPYFVLPGGDRAAGAAASAQRDARRHEQL